MAFIMVYIGFQTVADCKRLCEHLLQEKLIASFNYFPIKSVSCWPGQMSEGDEIACIMKTASKNWDKLVHEIEKSHIYKIPCIMKFDVESNKGFDDWVNRETGG